MGHYPAANITRGGLPPSFSQERFTLRTPGGGGRGGEGKGRAPVGRLTVQERWLADANSSDLPQQTSVRGRASIAFQQSAFMLTPFPRLLA